MSDIMSVQDVINSAFGDETQNTVNFRMLKAVLLILGNQLRILQRHVAVSMWDRETGSAPKVTVSEVKIHTSGKKRRTSKRSKDDPRACIPEGAVICEAPPIRADSYEEPATTPSPMASAPSLSKDRLLIVGPEGRAPELSVVTKEQFEKLVAQVNELRERFNPVGVPEFPENIEIMKSLRRGASLTDAMAALQISARLEAFEKAFGIMISLLTTLALKTPGVNLKDFRDLAKDYGVEVPHEIEIIELKRESPESVLEEEPKDCVTYEELDHAMVELHDEVISSMKKLTVTAQADTDKNKQIVREIEQHLSMLLNFGERFEQLEAEVAQYSDKVNAIDTTLSSQITSFQEHLAQMQFDLETGLENLSEALANASTDPEVIAELNRNLTALKEDLEFAASRQKESKDFQNDMALDLADLWKQIELIREAKSDRDEVTDALRDKAGIGSLNGLVSLEQFQAVRGDLEKRIRAAYDKFNNQEVVWQKIIDELITKLNEKGDWTQFIALRDGIGKYLNEFRDKIDKLLQIVGEPRAAATSKLLFRNTECLSCRVPARMETEPPTVPLLPALKKPSAGDAKDIGQPGEDGDHRICIQGLPIPHPRDPRSHVCRRYCGGSHTMIPTVPRATQGITITRLPNEVSATVGADGKTYMTDELKVRKPCFACNVPKTSEPSEGSVAPTSKKLADTESFDMMSCMDWLPAVQSKTGSMAPPLPSID
ncbi:uncharacterized protein isoform X2 [Choristoneura fumiferana]|uniref:uncharacterized protein isoform X2 n=1 Tax=Choristoneura fumiferana TaxID=7141 RepID=UPI003D159D1C